MELSFTEEVNATPGIWQPHRESSAVIAHDVGASDPGTGQVNQVTMPRRQAARSSVEPPVVLHPQNDACQRQLRIVLAGHGPHLKPHQNRQCAPLEALPMSQRRKDLILQITAGQHRSPASPHRLSYRAHRRSRLQEIKSP